MRRRLRMEVARYATAEKAKEDGTFHLQDAARRAVIMAFELEPPVSELEVQAAALEMMEAATERLRAALLRIDTTSFVLRDLYRSDVTHITDADVKLLADEGKLK